MCFVRAWFCPCKWLQNGGVRARGENRQPSSEKIKIIQKDGSVIEKKLKSSIEYTWIENWKLRINSFFPPLFYLIVDVLFHIYSAYIYIQYIYHLKYNVKRKMYLWSVNPELKNRLWPAGRLMWGYCVCELTLKAGMRHCGWSDW